MLVGKKAFSVDLPAQLLPRGTSEGDWLIMTLQKSERLKRSYSRSLEGLLEKLGKTWIIKNKIKGFYRQNSVNFSFFFKTEQEAYLFSFLILREGRTACVTNSVKDANDVALAPIP